MVRLSMHTMDKGEGVAVFVALLGIIVTLQVLCGAYASGFAGYPDEPAHLVTALMVRDFLAGLDFSHPWRFAQQYYLHYPKVAIGHWPPLLYGLLGPWFLVFGASRASSMIFIAIVAATTSSIVYFTGKRLIGRSAGVLASVLFVASPLVQESSARVMTEHLVTLAMLASTLWFARFARTERIGDGLGFGSIAALAILTRGSAWALALMPGLTIAFTGRWYLLRRPGLWLSTIPVLLACVPWYVLTLGMEEGSWEGGAFFWLQAVPGFARFIYLALGFGVVAFAAIGVWATLIRVARRAEVTPEWAALAALAIATFILHCAVPTGIENRYMVTLVPPIVLFAAAGVDAIAHRLVARLPGGVVQFGLSLGLISGFCLESFALPTELGNSGYERLVQDVETRLEHVPQIWLISSGSSGEGSLTAAVALQEARPSSYILNGRKILAGGDWLWRNTQDRFDTPEKLAKLLAEIPVNVVVIDDRVSSDQHRPYQDRLRLVVSNGDRWQLLGSYPQMQKGVVSVNSLHVYARRPVTALTLGPTTIQRDLLVALIGRDELR